MSLENEDQSQLESPPENPSEIPPELNKKPKITYAREFLLSFSELELCKKVPEDFDPSLLSELQETSANKYGSNTYPKAGRWETRSTGSSDKDTDSQTERESFAPERKYGQYKARSWQPAGQDGLLGKPSGFVPGTSPNRTATYQLNRTSEPYQPPRPYKAAPYGRKDVDSCNDETFGSTEVSVTEEERKRRASFEMMRKEQHKVLQEKQSQKDKEKEQKEKEKMKSDGDDILNLIQGSNETAKIAIPQKEESLNENLSSSLKSSSSLSRPLVPPGFVPPGFTEKNVQKELEVKSEEKHITTEGFIIDEKKKEIMMPQNIITEGFIINENNKEISLPLNDNNTNSSSNISILEKFFGSTLSKTSETSSSFLHIENELPKIEEDLLIPPISSESSSNSKFAHLFTEEDSKPLEDNQSEDLLSIFSKNTPNKEKISKFNPLNSIPMEENIIFDHIISPQSQTLNIIKKDPISNFLSPSNGPVQNPNPNPNPAVLTCEEIEQLMLSQAGINDNINNSNSNNINIPSRRNPNPNWQLGGPTDNSASHHLFSLLTKEKSSEIPPNLNPNPNININMNSPKPSININNNRNESVTLEAIFGAAFMNELHSMDAPISSLQDNNSNINNNNSLLFPNLVENNKREIDNTINLPEEESLFSVNDPPLPLNPNSSSLLHQFSNPNSSQNLGLNPFHNTNIPPDTHSNLNDPNIILNQRMRQQQFPRQHNQFDFDQGRHISMHQQQSMRGFDVDPVRHGLNRIRGPGPHNQVHVRHHLPHEMVGLQRNFPVHHQQQQQHNPGFGGAMGVGNQMQRVELERMMQMEMRAKAAQQAARVPPAGYFGPDLDLDFRYR